jgi:hypothetical protein
MNTQTHARRTTTVENLEKRVLFSAIEVTDFGAKPNDGQDDRGAIQAAIDAAGHGDTVYFADGTYNVNGQVRLKDGINITAINELKATIDVNAGSGGGDTNAANFAFCGYSLHDFSFTNLAVRSNNGIFWVSDTVNTRFTDNDFVWGGGGAPGYNQLAFFAGNNQDDMHIEENYFHDSPGSDRNVELWGMQNSSYSRNLFYNVTDGGHIMAPRDNVSFSYNYGSHIHRMGIEIQGDTPSNNLRVVGNVFTDWVNPYYDSFGLSIVNHNSHNTVVADNYLRANIASGRSWGQADGSGARRFGFAVEAGGLEMTVKNNTIVGDWVAGVVASRKGVVVQDNHKSGPSNWADWTSEPSPDGFGSIVFKGANTVNRNMSRAPTPPRNRNDVGVSADSGQHDNGQHDNGSSNEGSDDAADTISSRPWATIDDAGQTYLSDLTWTSARSGWGAVEIDGSNGDRAAGDGNTITLGGQRYRKGMGVAVNSDVTYNLDGQYSTFFSDIGIDNEVRNKGSMTFQVWADNKMVYQSGVMRGQGAARHVQINVSGVNQLRLVTTNADDGDNSDHGDWAAARLAPAKGANQPDNQLVSPPVTDTSA